MAESKVEKGALTRVWSKNFMCQGLGSKGLPQGPLEEKSSKGHSLFSIPFSLGRESSAWIGEKIYKEKGCITS